LSQYVNVYLRFFWLQQEEEGTVRTGTVVLWTSAGGPHRERISDAAPSINPVETTVETKENPSPHFSVSFLGSSSHRLVPAGSVFQVLLLRVKLMVNVNAFEITNNM
jgi:hypothetical protein